jgi:hypothetical protein
MIIPGEVVSALTFPGVIVHELGHELACKAVGLQVYRVCYFRFGNPAGYVEHSPPTRYRESFIITVAPFFVNSFFAIIFFAIALSIPSSIKISFFEIRYLFYWLGFSIGMHAFPSSGDAKSLWDFTKRMWRRNPLIILGVPVIALIKIADVLSIAWFDLIFALGLMYLTKSILKEPIIVFKILITSFNYFLFYLFQFYEWIDSTIVYPAYLNYYVPLFYSRFPLSFLSFRFFVGGAFLVLVLVLVTLPKLKSKLSGAQLKSWKVPVGSDDRRSPRSKILYASCFYCGKKVYLPFQCNYCNKYFCDGHFLPPKHDCVEIDSWKNRKMPPGVVWEHRGAETFYRKY